MVGPRCHAPRKTSKHSQSVWRFPPVRVITDGQRSVQNYFLVKSASDAPSIKMPIGQFTDRTQRNAELWRNALLICRKLSQEYGHELACPEKVWIQETAESRLQNYRHITWRLLPLLKRLWPDVPQTRRPLTLAILTNVETHQTKR